MVWLTIYLKLRRKKIFHRGMKGNHRIRVRGTEFENENNEASCLVSTNSNSAAMGKFHQPSDQYQNINLTKFTDIIPYVLSAVRVWHIYSNIPLSQRA